MDIKIGNGSRGGRDGMILGSPVAGEAIAISRNIRGFKVGDRLVANVRGGKTYAEEV